MKLSAPFVRAELYLSVGNVVFGLQSNAPADGLLKARNPVL